jgi:hypothetical protein
MGWLTNIKKWKEVKDKEIKIKLMMLSKEIVYEKAGNYSDITVIVC